MALTNSKKPGWVQSLEKEDKTTGTAVSRAADRKTTNDSLKSLKSGLSLDKPRISSTIQKASEGSSGGGSNKNSQYTDYNYTIGSDYGKQKAQEMGIGRMWTATDGSLWEKENDGSITVHYNGKTYKNAYVPDDSGNWATLGQQQMKAGVPWQYVQSTLNSHTNKAGSSDELRQYMYDNNYWDMYNYIQAQKYAERTEPYKNKLDEVEQGRPEDYENPYKAEIDAILKEILNRDDFSYDVASDPLYQQYADMYRREGDRAMRETMAEAAASAGGMNTYAMTAAQQANNYYASQLNDRIPELYQLAYDMYLNDKESKIQDLGILQNMDATQYGRYRDTMNDWYNDKNFAYGAYQDAIAQGNWEKSFDYNSMVDARNWDYENYWANKDDAWRNKQWDYGVEQDKKQWDYGVEQDNKKWSEQEKADARADVKYWMNLGYMPSDELIAKSGWDKSLVEQRVKQVQIENGVYG